MSARGLKCLTIVLGIMCVALLVLSGWLFWNYAWLSVRVAFAGEQTEIFEGMREGALRESASGAADNLRYVMGYYPSGSKQQTGSELDGVVERQRASAARDIINYLRSKTGEDLGDDSEAWIRKYASK